MHTLAITTGNVLAGISWDPTIRGILSVAVGVIVLMGSVYLILGTNTGNRLGFLLAMTGFWGWMAIMGLMWWIYGIGMVGQAPAWHVVEYNTSDPGQAVTDVVRDLDLSPLPTDGGQIDYEAIDTLAEENPEAFAALSAQIEEQSDGWELLTPSAPVRNEVEATVASAIPECATCSFGIDAPADYISHASFVIGGKDRNPDDANAWDRAYTKVKSAFTLQHPPRYAVLQIQKVVPQEPQPGEAPPLPVADPDEPIINVVMLRDIGDLRFPPAVITLGSTAIFLLLCWVLHQRERLLEENLEQAEAVKAGGA